jgi:cell division protein FtsZ
MADQVLFNAVKGISDIITQQGIVNVDFADAISVMSDQGMALMGIGRGKGERRAIDAAEKAISSPLLEDVSVEGAMGILVNVTGGPSLTLHEVNAAIELITEAAHDDANIIFGYVVDEKMDDEVSITVIATGFEGGRQRAMKSPEFNASFISPAFREVQSVAPRNTWDKRDSELVNVSQVPKINKALAEARVPVLAPLDDDMNVQASTYPNSAKSANAAKEDEYDIPAFLRRNAEGT